MQKWLISADTEKWDHEALFARDGYIMWRQYTNYEVGDIVYIYAKKPIARVMFKTVVEEESIHLDDTDQKYAKLRLIKKVDNEDLSLKYLNEYGLKVPPQKAFKFNGDLQEYIEKYFDEDYEPESQNKSMWLIHESDESQKNELFKKFNFVAGEWAVGDLSGMDNEQVKSIFVKEYENSSSSAINNYFLQYDSFVNNMKVGDYIISSDKTKKEYLLGICISDYYFSDKIDDRFDYPYRHYRDVEWLYSIKWKDISKKAKNSMFLAKTVVEIEGILKDEFLEFFNYVPFPSDEKRNKIYFGAPGTGKSYKLNEDKEGLLDDYITNYERVTCHPDYTYGNFVGSYKPITDEESIKYEFVPGPFMRVLKNAFENSSEPYLLIIEEINRANVAAVFGDVFQLLDRDDYTKSEYPIESSEEIKKYLNKNKIRIPSNMFIWATMNSADQGVFPMDTAFKRRWDFEYLGINDGEDKIENLKFKLNGKEYSWNRLRRAINNVLVQEYNINEDKLLGPFFAFTECIDEDEPSIEIPTDKFIDVFKNKIIMYLFEDVARSRRNELFEGVEKNSNLTYSQICKKFEKDGIEIFCDSVLNNL